ncbi:hypothetical protein DVP14_01780 [Yersinia enterocolitica]|nr:hypothetical protein [Yersinia enterocolitica]EKN6072491.1 hypothetical protein [Yersinia enterocolitica]
MCVGCLRSPQSLTCVSSWDSLSCRLPATRIIGVYMLADIRILIMAGHLYADGLTRYFSEV